MGYTFCYTGSAWDYFDEAFLTAVTRLLSFVAPSLSVTDLSDIIRSFGTLQWRSAVPTTVLVGVGSSSPAETSNQQSVVVDRDHYPSDDRLRPPTTPATTSTTSSSPGCRPHPQVSAEGLRSESQPEVPYTYCTSTSPASVSAAVFSSARLLSVDEKTAALCLRWYSAFYLSL